jgi:hypothetical protein
MCLSGVTCLPVLPVMKYCKQTQFIEQFHDFFLYFCDYDKISIMLTYCYLHFDSLILAFLNKYPPLPKKK